jgi:hypothetical protein
MAVVGNRYYNDPMLGQAFANLSAALGPPSAGDLNAYANAKAKREEAARLAALFDVAQQSGFDQATFDRMGQAAGQWTPSTGYYGVDTTAATSRANNAADNARALEDRRLQEQAAMERLGITDATARYKVDADNAASNTNAALTMRGKAVTDLFGPLNPGQIAPAVPSEIASTLGLPMVDQRTGLPKAPTEDETKAAILRNLPLPDQRSVAMSSVPVEQVIMGDKPVIQPRDRTYGQEPFVKPAADAKPVNYRTPDGKLGTATPGPTGQLVDTQTGAAVPQGSVVVGINVQAGNPDAALGATAMRDAKNDIVVEDINRALAVIADSPGFATGIGNQLTGAVGGTPGNTLNALLGTIKANVGFDQLQAMRMASPTGGALGQVSDTENKLLQSVLGSLEASQDPATLSYNLKRLNNVVLDIVHGPGNGPERFNLDADTGGVPTEPVLKRPLPTNPAAPGAAPRRRYNPATGSIE